MGDYMRRALAFGGQVKVAAVVATQAVEEARKRHDTWSASTAALGRTLVGTVLLASSLKGSEKLTIQVHGDGLGGKIFTEANGQGEMRGYITQPHVSLPLNEKGKLDVRSVVGTNGSITVIKDLGMKEPFSGQVPIVDGELGVDLTYYMAVSEQINGAIGLSVLVNTDESVAAAGGFLIQLMPGATEETISALEQRIACIPLVSKLIDQGETPEEILERLVGQEHIQWLEKQEVCFKCPCNREHFDTGLMSIGAAELQRFIEEDGGAEIVCHFCGDQYMYSKENLQELIERIQLKTDENEEALS